MDSVDIKEEEKIIQKIFDTILDRTRSEKEKRNTIKYKIIGPFISKSNSFVHIANYIENNKRLEKRWEDASSELHRQGNFAWSSVFWIMMEKIIDDMETEGIL